MFVLPLGPSSVLRVLTCLVVFLLFSAMSVRADTWVDATGKHKVEAEFVRIASGNVILRGKLGKEIKVPFNKLSAESQTRAEQLAGSSSSRESAVLIPLTDAGDLEKLAKSQRSAERAYRMYEQFLSQTGLDYDERQKAEKKLSNWQERAEKKMFRWGHRWETVGQIQQRVEQEEQLLRQAHRLIEVKNDEMARERFEEASEENPEGVRADFYLGILHSLVGRYPKGALERFSLCVKRLERSNDQARGAQRSNLIAALNNRAICYVRRGKHPEALKDWAKAIDLAPQTPELIQNLGYYAQLSGMVRGWGVSKASSKRIADQYARLTVANESAAYSENTGFLFIPYVDAPTMPDFEDVSFVPERDATVEELLHRVNNTVELDLRIASWATAVAVDSDHLVTSRAVAEGALGFWVRKDGQLQRTRPGKVVAISGAHDLALIRFEGLAAEVVPFETGEPARAMDIRIASFPEPGILSDGMLVQKGAVVDIASVFIPLGKKYLTRRVSQTAVASTGNGIIGGTNSTYETLSIPIQAEYIYGLVHDVSLNHGAEGAPLINEHGRIVGLDLSYRYQNSGEERYRSAISHSEVRAFLNTTGLEFPAIDARQSGVIQNLDEFVQNMADNAVYQVAVVARVPRLSWSDRLGEIRGIRKKSGWNAYEDPWCIRCDGSGDVACHGRRCVEGHVSYKQRSQVGSMPGTNQPIYESTWINERCSVCSGRGFLTCPHCNGAHFEPLLN